MTLVQMHSHSSPDEKRGRERRRKSQHFGPYHSWEWPSDVSHGSGYEFEDELSDQLYRLPSCEYVEQVLSDLRVSTLRELSKEVVNGGIEHVTGQSDRLEYIRLLNSWIATAEETIAAGRNVNRIAARRKSFVKSNDQE